MNKRYVVIILGGIALLLLLALAGTLVINAIVGAEDVPHAKLAASSKEASPDSLTILYTCDTRGHIEPCGCASGMAGGIGRRMTYLSSSRPEHSILVDAGDVTAGARDWERLEFEYLLRGYKTMDYDAVNIGHREAMMDAEKLAEFKTKYDHFISANLADASGALIFDPYRISEMSRDSRVGIIGIMGETAPREELGRNIAIIPPTEALARWIPEVKSKAEFIVLLAFATEDEIRAIAEQFFEINVIVGGKTLQPTGEPLHYNKSTVVLITDKGKGIGRLDLARGVGGTWSPKNEIIRLEETMEVSPAIASLILDYKETLKKLDIEPHRDDEEGLTTIVSTRSGSADRFSGAKSCLDCHPKAFKTWEESKHSHAYHTLETKDQQHNPRCLECHTVGYGATDGFTNHRETAHLENVACESCHGRGELHSKFHAAMEKSVAPPRMKTASCTICHDPDNSPGFDFESYWPKIAHGGE